MTETKPSNPYGLAKDTLRKFMERLKTERPFTLQWARLFYVYGQGQNPGSLLAQLERALEQGDAGVSHVGRGAVTRLPPG